MWEASVRDSAGARRTSHKRRSSAIVGLIRRGLSTSTRGLFRMFSFPFSISHVSPSYAYSLSVIPTPPGSHSVVQCYVPLHYSYRLPYALYARVAPVLPTYISLYLRRVQGPSFDTRTLPTLAIRPTIDFSCVTDFADRLHATCYTRRHSQDARRTRQPHIF